ncbi:MAG TPA: transglutaminase family protein [Tepidisphaeraceae bacterium]|nr:transglutaminase family protein [Tepidisphaeraceae bacterium]
MNPMTAVILMVGVGALQLSRAARAASVSGYMMVGTVIVVALCIARLLLGRTSLLDRWTDSKWPQVFAVISAAAMLASQSLSLGAPLEGSVSTSLLVLAGGLYVFDGRVGRHDGVVAAICIAVALLLLPTFDFAVRGGVVAVLVIVSAGWLAAGQIEPSGSRRWSTFFVVCAICLALLVPLVAAHRFIRPVDLNPSYAGWVPASGGPASESERAARGVGDGQDEISSDHAASTGLDQNERIAESSLDSLYDLWTEAYGEPVTPAEQQKTIALKQDGLNQAQGTDRGDSRTGRSFDIKRRAPAERAASGEKQGTALLELRGPLPAWIALEALERFDGDAWQPRYAGRSFVPVRHLGERWMELLLRPISPAFGRDGEYSVRVGELNGRTLPLPPHTTQFRMGLIDQPTFFSSDEAGVVRLARRTLPTGASIDVTAKLVDASRLLNVEPALPAHSKPLLLEVAHIEPELAAWANRMTFGTPRGWPQVLALMRSLQESAHYDPSWCSPRPAFETLQRDGRGNDYHFATAGVLGLRSLGYPARLASGVFASADRVNEQSGWAQLNRDDLHCWVQIRMSDGTWIDLDPTPGFPLLAVPMNWRQQFHNWAQQAATRAKRQWVAIISAFCFLGVVWFGRRQWLDGVATRILHIRGPTPARVARLIERRASLVGRKRAAATPVGKWLHTLGSSRSILELIDAMNQQLYCPQAPVIRFDATSVLKELSLRNLRKQLDVR